MYGFGSGVVKNAFEISTSACSALLGTLLMNFLLSRASTQLFETASSRKRESPTYFLDLLEQVGQSSDYILRISCHVS